MLPRHVIPAFVLLSFVLIQTALAVNTSAPYYPVNERNAAAQAMLLQPGVREVAMGGAGTTVAKGHTAAWYNPAATAWQQEGVAGVGGHKIESSYGAPDAYLGRAACGMTLGDGHRLTVSAMVLRWESMPTGYEGSGSSIETTHTSLGVAYARIIATGVAVGGSIEWFRDQLADRGMGFGRDNLNGTGFAFDAGLIYKMTQRLTLAAALRNYGPNVQYIDASQRSPMPVSFNVGAEWRAVEFRDHVLALAGDAYKPLVQDYRRSWVLAPIRAWYDEDIYRVDRVVNEGGYVDDVVRRSTFRAETRQIDVRLGAEYAWRDRAFLRCGWFRDWDGEREWLTYGAGVSWPVRGISIIADIARISAETGQFGDPADGRTALSLAVAW